MHPENHLPSPDLGRLLRDELSASARGEAEEHLSHCSPCRSRLAELIVAEGAATAPLPEAAPEELQRIARAMVGGDRAPAGSARRSSRRVWLPLAAAVLVAVGLSAIWTAAPPERASEDDVLRGLTTEATQATVELTWPLADAVATSERALFSWQPIEGAERYDFELLNEVGDLLFETSTTDPSIELPRAGLGLEPGSHCYWSVHATLRDGTVVASRPRAVSFSGR